MSAIEKLLEVMARLRDPKSGCPWDVEQDFATIAPYTIEEAYEVADAIQRLGVPSRNEIAKLTKSVEELTVKVDQLKASPARKPAKKAAAKAK